MAVTNADRVGESLKLLALGLGPFVERECESHWGENWVEEVSRSDRGQPQEMKIADVQVQLRIMVDQWRYVFSKILSHADRALVGELIDIRNRWAHQEAFSGDDAYRAVDSTHRLLMSISAGNQAELADKLKQDLLRQRYEKQTRNAQRARGTTSIEGKPEGGLKPWREVVTPHKDVYSGSYQQAEFAADLHQVWRGEAATEYGDPEEFFRRTFLTDGLSKLLVDASKSLAGVGGPPIVGLQTNFGGGKTHSLIALYHLAGAGADATSLASVDEVLKRAGVDEVPSSRRAVLVGTMLGPGDVETKEDGTEIRTIWGEMAWQLGGAEAFRYVADADAAGTNPGDSLLDLFKAFSPCLVLIDEWVAYARQLYGDRSALPAGSFDAQFTFAQALSEAARAVPGTLVVVSVPASDIEVGGEAGKAALERLDNVVGRMESSWRPASAEEGFEIVRRRLFDDLDSEAARERDAVVHAFAELYRRESTEFPSHVREGDYERRMAASYPIHPELFDQLFTSWSELETFQRTRGVLRLMASVIHELWERNDQSLMILPAHVPIDAPAVTAELTRYLEEGWAPVIESDVDGANSRPLRIDRDNPTLSRYSATRRVARTIYMGSAPSQKAAHRGIEDRAVKLGCVQPGEAPATFGDALRRLSDVATYLYADSGRYWYSRQPSVTSTANDRAANFADEDVDEEVRGRLRGVRDRGAFAGIHASPGDPGDVPDEPAARLVLLGPEYDHQSKSEASDGLAAARRFLDERGSGPRQYRNMLVFLAPDHGRLDDLRSGVRQWMAWRSINAEKDTLGLDLAQAKQAQTKESELDQLVDARVLETWQWLITPAVPADDPTGPVCYETMRVGGGEPLAQRVGKKLKSEEGLVTEYSGVRLRLDLDRVLWGGGDHVKVAGLRDAYAKYLYLPRLRDEAVLHEAIRDGIAKLTWAGDAFALAEAYDEASGEYRGLIAGLGSDAPIGAAAVLVKPDVAEPLIEQRGTGGGDDRPSSENGDEQEAPGDTDGDKLPTRFYGRVELDPVRFGRQVGQISDEVIAHLSRMDGAGLVLTFEIEASAPGGFDDAARRAIGENASTLKFDEHRFED